ncbi:MAG TPA: MFS domain-containing histidine kinase [Verrucomicrobiae bacterium]
MTNRNGASVSARLVDWIVRFTDGFIPIGCRADAELFRRSRLTIRFSFLGAVSGALYAGFFTLVEHYFGVAIIVLCSLVFAAVPFVLKRSAALDVCGNLLSGVMVMGFAGLCGVEGGMHGHALAWLACIPLCALLLVGKYAASIWVIVSFMASAGMIALGLAGVTLPKTYPPEWDGLITAFGYLGLIPFMFLMGMSFETSREAAFDKMQQAVKELEKSNEELMHLNREKSEFMGIAAHDLKNPLMIIIGNAELIGRARNPGMMAQLVDNIRVSGTRMHELIKNLLDANAIEEGKFRLDIGRCNLCEVVENSKVNNAFAATRKEIELQLTGAGGEVWVRADDEAMLQVMDNLVSNAVKYSMPNSIVDVRVEVMGSRAVVAVKDEGPGLSEEDQKKLFQKFTRLTAKPTGGESSNGLGLSIVKRLVEAMRGRVECQSVLGQGATFLVSLPLWIEEEGRKSGDTGKMAREAGKEMLR